MPYEVTLNADEQLSEVVSTGELSSIDIKDALQLISKLQKESGVTHVLSDATGQQDYAVTLDITGVTSALPTGLRVAVIVRRGQHTKPDMDLN